MNCINIKSKEFKSLKEKVNMPSPLLAMKISKWQSDNNSTEFPTYEEVTGIKPSVLTEFNTNSMLESIGSPVQYTKYSKTTDNPTIEGFKEYMIENEGKLPEGSLQKLFLGNQPSQANWNTLTSDNIEPISLTEDAEALPNILFGRSSTTGTLTEVVDNLLKTTESISGDARIYVDKISKLAKESNPEVVLTDALPNNISGQYDTATNTITLNNSLLNDSTTPYILSTLLHEIVHSVTIDALSNPKNTTEKNFVDKVNEIINEYGEKSQAYGFSNPVEFVAELYSNKEFADELKGLMSGNESLFDKIITAIRRLFGFPARSRFTEILSENTSFVESGKLTSTNYGVFNKEYFKDTDFTDENQKLSYYVGSIKDSIENQLKTVIRASKRVGMTTKERKKIQTQLEKFKKQFETLDELETLEAIGEYATYVREQAHFIKESVRGRELAVNKKKYDLNLIRSLEQMLSDFTLNDGLYNFAISLDTKTHPDMDAGYVHAVKTIVDNVKTLESIKNETVQRLLERKKELVINIINNPAFITRAFKKFKDQFAEDYRVNKPEGYTEATYIAHMSNINKDKIDAYRRELAESFVHNRSYDIGMLELQLTDTGGVISSMIDVANAMLSKFKIDLMQTYREGEAKFAKLHKDYTATNRGHAISKKYSNLLSKDAKGNHYLRSKYKMEVLDSYNEMIDKANIELYGNYTQMNVSSGEVKKIYEHNETLFRNEDNKDFAKDSLLNLQSKEKTSSLNVQVTEKKNYSKENKDNDINEVVRIFTDFRSLAELEKSKLYANERSRGSKENPALYAYLQGTADLTAYRVQRVTEKTSKNFKTSQAYKDWLNKYTEHNVPKGANPFSVQRTIKKEYLDPTYDALDEASKNALEAFNGQARVSDLAYKSGGKLQVSLFGAVFVKLPSRHKSALERRTEGDLVNIVKDNFKDLQTLREDDYDIGEPLDSQGNVIRKLSVRNRGYVRPEDQSLEVFDLFREELEYSLRYTQGNLLETELSALRDVVGNKKFIKQNVRTGGISKNSNNKNQPTQYIDGVNSNTYKKLTGMMESNLYDITLYNGGKWGSFEVNKLAGAINGFGASVALTMNSASGIANVMNGVAQLHIEAIGGHFFNLKDLTLSERDYTKDLPHIMSDLSKPVKESKTNAMLQMFDFVGGMSMAQQSFLKDSLYKKLVSKEQMNVMNEMGEHAMSAIITGAILRNIKVMNADRKFINSKGEVVASEKDAASMYDMLKFNENTGIMTIDSNVVYTTHTYEVSLKDGGLSHISALIKKKSVDLYGAYDTRMLNEFQKTIIGKSIFMFKKFFVPGLQLRYRGYSNLTKSREEIREDELLYSNALKEYEEGYYISLARMLRESALNLRSQGLKFIPSYYNKLSDYEKANIRKATTELIATTVILPALALAVIMGYDDDERPYALLYQINRLQQELNQFKDPRDLIKMTTNPIAGLNIVNNALSLMGNIITPLNINPTGNEHYFDWLSQDREGNNQLLKSVYKTLPFTSQLNREWKDLVNYQSKY